MTSDPMHGCRRLARVALAVLLLQPTAAAWQHALSSPFAPRCRAARIITLSELKVKKYQPTNKPAALMTLERRLEQLRALCEQHGHALPSAENQPDPSLVTWAARQRALHRQGTLPAVMIEELEAVGFVWDKLEHAWNAK